MFLEILMYAGIAAVVLLLLYLLTRRFPTLGDAFAFLCVLVGRPFVKIEWVLKEGGAYFYLMFEKSLQYPPNVDDTWKGVYVIARLILLLVCSIILTADVYNMLERLPPYMVQLY